MRLLAKTVGEGLQRAESITDMQALYDFIYQQHGAYAVGVSPDRLQGAERKIYDPKIR